MRWHLWATAVAAYAAELRLETFVTVELTLDNLPRRSRRSSAWWRSRTSSTARVLLLFKLFFSVWFIFGESRACMAASSIELV